MFVRIFVNSWLISIGFKFWMIEAVFALIGQAKICLFIAASFFLEPPAGRLPLSRLFSFSLTWSLFGCPTRDVSQRFWSAMRLIENGG